MSDVIINIIDETVVVEVMAHDRDPRQLPPWTWGDLIHGRVTWGTVRNAWWSALVNKTL